jgi:hypothetical protein
MVSLHESLMNFSSFNKLFYKQEREPADWLFEKAKGGGEEKPVKIIINTVKCN